MKGTLMLVGVIGAAAVALAVVVGAGARGDRALGTLHVIEHATTDAVTETSKKGDSAGDILTFANEIYDASNTKEVGSDNGYCVRTVPGKAWECFWTSFLKGGQITVEGPFLDAGDSTLAITGGTGAYRNARGTMSLHARNKKGTEYDFVYRVS